jgi:hypothetical protein
MMPTRLTVIYFSTQIYVIYPLQHALSFMWIRQWSACSATFFHEFFLDSPCITQFQYCYTSSHTIVCTILSMPEWYFDPVDYYILTYSLCHLNWLNAFGFPFILREFVNIILENSVLLLNYILWMANGIEYYPHFEKITVQANL